MTLPCALRRYVLVPLSLVLAAACAAPGVPGSPAPRYDAATLYATTSYTGASFSPDGRHILLTSDATGVFNVHALELATGRLRPLTASTSDATYAVGWFPEDERFLYTADQGGNELNHLYLGTPAGESWDLTPGEGLKASFLSWGADDASFFALTNERDPAFFDLYRYRFAAADAKADAFSGALAPGVTRELWYRNPGGFEVSVVSRDGAWVGLTKTNDNADVDVYVARAGPSAGAPVLATPHESAVTNGPFGFSPDGTTLAYASDEGSEFRRAWTYDLATGERRLVFEDDWDVMFYEYSEDGRFLVTGVNADARTRVRVFEAASGREVELPDVPAGDVTGVTFERGRARMAFYVNGDSSPANLWLFDGDAGTARPLTAALDPAVDAAHLVEAEVVRYPSFDGLPIPALLYRPQAASPRVPAPALVWVHGGPGGQSRRGYNPTIQHLVNHGYAVLAVNNRGSWGYGKTFHHLDDRRHGEVDLQDCVYARRWLETLDWVDGERVGIIGGSYGGYMVCAALAFTPEAFDVGIDIFGVTNWPRTLASIPPWWEEFRAALYAELGDPELDRERLEARSPLLHADRIERPLLVVQGQNDPRVLVAESEEIVAAVRAKGVPVEYVLFPDEGHGFRRRENRIRASEAYLAFLETHLAGGGRGAAAGR